MVKYDCYTRVNRNSLRYPDKHLKNISVPEIKFIVVLIILLSNIIVGEYKFSLIYTGELNGYINPVWSPDSKTFSLQTINDIKGKTATLFIYQIGEKSVNYAPAFPREQKVKSGPQRIEKYPPKEEAMGWFMSKKGNLLLYSTINRQPGKNKDIFQLWAHFVSKPLNNKRKPKRVIDDQDKSGPGNIYVIPNSNRILFTLLSENRRIINYFDKGNNYFYDMNKFDLPVQSICTNKSNTQLFVITGRETVYGTWISNNNGNSFQKIKIPHEYTILNDALFSTHDDHIISFIGSNNNMRNNEKAVLCVYDLNRSNYITKINIFRHRQPPPFTRPSYHQWHPINDHLFYIRANDGNEKQLFYEDFIQHKEYKTTLPETNLQTFNISPDGQYLIVITNDRDKNMRIYRIYE